MLRRGALLQTILVIVCTLGAAWLQHIGFEPLMRSENFVRDAIARCGRKTPPNPQLVYMAIDNDSVSIDASADLAGLFDLKTAEPDSIRALELMSKGWPWSRAVHGLILQRLMQAGAKTVIFDLTFPTATANDPEFRAMLDRYRDRVVLGCNFVRAAATGYASNAPTLSVPTDSLIPQTNPIDDRVGFVNYWPDADDIVRSAQFAVTFEQVNGEFAATSDSERYLSLTARAAIKAGFADAVAKETASHFFRYTGGPLTFRPHSIFEIFVPEYWERNYASGNFFRDKIVMVGAFGNWQHDEHRTTFGLMPGPELQLNALNALLHHEFIRELPHVNDLEFIVLGGLISWALWLFIQTPWLRFCAMLGVSAAWLMAAVELFNHAGIYILAFTPLMVVNFNSGIALLYEVVLERRESTRVRGTLERYVSRNVVRELLDHPQDYTRALGGVLKPVTILFSDIRNFTLVSARLDPHGLVTQLNEYFTSMVDCVFAHRGTLDKFIGDAVMAVWGNATSHGAEADAADALHAALAMREKLRALNVKWKSEGRPQLEIGIALNHGDVVVGNIGSQQRMEFTVIGSPVNITWRLQELTKRHTTDLLIGESAADLLCYAFALHPVTTFQPDPAASAVKVFTVADSAVGAT
ncbi:MAG: adenylate cyclase [Chthoniobacter sp.]|jgi:adenylate cyclase|nr:adenylate cyclase [Chthoniobacter sp.]